MKKLKEYSKKTLYQIVSVRPGSFYVSKYTYNIKKQYNYYDIAYLSLNRDYHYNPTPFISIRQAISVLKRTEKRLRKLSVSEVKKYIQHPVYNALNQNISIFIKK